MFPQLYAFSVSWLYQYGTSPSNTTLDMLYTGGTVVATTEEEAQGKAQIEAEKLLKINKGANAGLYRLCYRHLILIDENQITNVHRKQQAYSQ